MQVIGELKPIKAIPNQVMNIDFIIIQFILYIYYYFCQKFNVIILCFI